MKSVVDLTSIGWIGIVKRSGDEWSSYTKKFQIVEKPKFATIRLNSQGVCGIYINGEFVESSCGRFMNRITYAEITSLLHEGENEITLELGSHFFQPMGVNVYNRRGAWFSAVAAEIEIQTEKGSQVIVTDESWKGSTEEGQIQPTEFGKVSQADYDRFWKSAAFIREPKEYQIPKTIEQVVGSDYAEYVNKPWQVWAEPVETVDAPVLRKENESDMVVTYDFGKTQVGYIQFEYEAECDSNVTLLFEYFELTEDFGEHTRCIDKLEKLAIRQPVKQGHHTVDVLRRRATRYMQMHIPEGVKVQNVRFRLSLLPGEYIGWFHTSDSMLNQIWEVGKYTLHINKHQEYESCPRHEMKFFSGDGVICGVTDYYTFGDNSVVESSLSLTEMAGNGGLRYDMYESNGGLWDYPAWRILTVYNQYRYFNDAEFVKRYYEESVNCLLWTMGRTSSNNLIYQYPLWGSHVHDWSESVEYTCSFDRLGEKPYLNALLYKSLLCMAEMADVVGDERGAEWREKAEQVKEAFNDRLWSEEAGAYLDTYDTSYIPQEGNALAVLYGLADENRTKKVFETLERELWTPYGSTILSKETTHTLGGSKTISPTMCTHEAEARFLNGDAEGGLELIRRCWGTMIRKGAGTFWEYAPNDETACWPHRCHGWASGCTYLLSAYVLGIRPETPGYEVVRFEPYSGLEEYSGVVPTVKGLIAVKCTTVSGKKQYELVVPKGTTLKNILPKDASLIVTEYEKEDQN